MASPTLLRGPHSSERFALGYHGLDQKKIDAALSQHLCSEQVFSLQVFVRRGEFGRVAFFERRNGTGYVGGARWLNLFDSAEG